MFKWKKLGLVFNPAEVKNKYWINEFAQGPATLLFEDFVRVYFSCRPKPDVNGQYVSYSAFVDLDRKNLFTIRNMSSEPVLKLGGTGTFDEFGTYPISVIRNNDEVRAYYGGWTRCESVPFNVAIGMATSRNDGKTFTKSGDGPILSYTPDEPFILSGPKIRKYNGVWYLWYIAGKKWIMADGKPEPVYKIRMASSVDGLVWKKFNKNIIEDMLGENEAQASPDVFFSNNTYHMFFCYRQASDFRRNKDRSYRIGYAYSADSFCWTRDDSKAGIDVSDNGWDSEMLAYPHIMELDGSFYMFYLAEPGGQIRVRPRKI